MLILGPFRPYAVRFYQRYKSNQPLEVDRRDIFPELKADQVVNSLNDKGYALGGKVPTDYVTQIVRYCENTGLMTCWNPHKECDAINAIARNTKIVGIARQYLGAEPILWLTQLNWSFGSTADKHNFLRSRYKEPLLYDVNAFHYDALDFKSVSLFVYLTDVDASSGPHVVVENTHANKSVADLCQIVRSDTAIHQKFGDRIKMILGEKGTMFFEETSSYHKASRCQSQRLLLMIDYVLRRSPPPERMVVATTSLRQQTP